MINQFSANTNLFHIYENTLEKSCRKINVYLLKIKYFYRDSSLSFKGKKIKNKKIKNKKIEKKTNSNIARFDESFELSFV